MDSSGSSSSQIVTVKSMTVEEDPDPSGHSTW